MTEKRGLFRLWVVASIAWVLLVASVERVDKAIPSLFIATKAEVGAVSIAYSLAREDAPLRREAEWKLMIDPVFGEKADRVKRQFFARSHFINFIWSAFLPIALFPIGIFAAWWCGRWVREGFTSGRG